MLGGNHNQANGRVLASQKSWVRDVIKIVQESYTTQSCDKYDISHSVSFKDGGYLNQLTGLLEAEVNSLHGQGVKKLGQGLNIEALSHGGLVEAFTIKDAAGFNLSVQWHPEWKPEKSAVSRKIFEAFGTSCQEYSERHGR